MDNVWMIYSCKKNLFLLLKPALAILNKDNKTEVVSETIWPRKLLVGTALKLGKVDLTYTATPEKPSVIGKALGKEIASCIWYCLTAGGRFYHVTRFEYR